MPSGSSREWDHAQQEIDSLKAQNLGLLKLVSAYGILRYLTPSFIHAFTDSNPSVHLDYTEFPDSYVEQKVLDGEYDIGLSPSRPRTRSCRICHCFRRRSSLSYTRGAAFTAGRRSPSARCWQSPLSWRMTTS